MAKLFEPSCGSSGGRVLMASIREDVALERAFNFMRLIHEDGDISTRELAARMKISNGAAYYVLTALIEKGYVKAENFNNNRNKSGHFCLLNPAGLREKAQLTANFFRQQIAEYQVLDEEIKAFEAE